MGVIKCLPREVAEKIAAGEVVERPASVVKELVENSIDALARSILIDVEDGGKKRITVIDDGRGMEPDDLLLAVERHATSKISTESDLFNISTMGFRGEAMAAIGAVSRLAIESRVNKPDVIEGAAIRVEGSNASKACVCGCAGGTKVTVSDLFFNVPARLKFMRSASVEYGHIYECVTTLALANPDVRFELVVEGKKKFISQPAHPKDRAISVIGERFSEGLSPIDEAGDGISLKGWVKAGGRSAGKDLYVFLNRRPVRDRLIMHAVTAAFGETLSRGEYPAAVIFLDIDPSKVDVNVHPAKREVRFEKSGAVHDFISSAIRKALQIRPVASENFHVKYSSSLKDFSQSEIQKFVIPAEAGIQKIFTRTGSPLQARGDDSLFNESKTLSAIRYPLSALIPLTQYGLTYIVCEDVSGALVLIDQHAAHERLGFDELMRGYKNEKVPRQGLLIPETIELGPKELAYIEEHFDILKKAGFDIEPFGGNTIIVKAVPAILSGVALAPIFEKLAIEFETLGGSHSVDEAIERVFAVVACHRQVRAGDRLSIAEMESLISDIEKNNITSCPHGRPVLVRFDRPEIEKWFKR